MEKRDTFFSKIFFFFLILFLFNGNIINNQKVLAWLLDTESLWNSFIGRPKCGFDYKEGKYKLKKLVYEVLPFEEAFSYFPWVGGFPEDYEGYLKLCNLPSSSNAGMSVGMLLEETYQSLVLPSSTLDVVPVTYVPAPIREGEEILYQEHWPPFLPQEETIIPHYKILEAPVISPTPAYEQLVLPYQYGGAEWYTQLVFPTGTPRPTPTFLIPTFLIPFVVYYPAYKDVDYDGNVPLFLQRCSESFGFSKNLSYEIREVEYPNCIARKYKTTPYGFFATKVVEEEDKMYVYYFEPHSWFNPWKPVYWPVPSYVPYIYDPDLYPVFPICYVSPESDPRSPDYGQVHCVGQLMVLKENIYEKKEEYPDDPWPWEFSTSSYIMDYRKILEIMKDECQLEGFFEGTEPTFLKIFPYRDLINPYNYWHRESDFLKELYQTLDPYDNIPDDEQPSWDDEIYLFTRRGYITTTKEVILGYREFWEKMFWQGEWWRWRNRNYLVIGSSYMGWARANSDLDLRNYFDYTILDYLRAPVITCYNKLGTPSPTPTPSPIKIKIYKGEQRDFYDPSTREFTLLSTEELHPKVRKYFPPEITTSSGIVSSPVLTSDNNIYIASNDCWLFKNTALYFDCLNSTNTLFGDVIFSEAPHVSFFSTDFEFLTPVQKLISQNQTQILYYIIRGSSDSSLIPTELIKFIPYSLNSDNPIPFEELYMYDNNSFAVFSSTELGLSTYDIDCASCPGPNYVFPPYKLKFKPLIDLIERYGEQLNQIKGKKWCDFSGLENNRPNPSDFLELPQNVSVKIVQPFYWLNGMPGWRIQPFWDYWDYVVLAPPPLINVSFPKPLEIDTIYLYEGPLISNLAKIRIRFRIYTHRGCVINPGDIDSFCLGGSKTPQLECERVLSKCGFYPGLAYSDYFQKEIPANISFKTFLLIPRFYFIFERNFGFPLALLNDGNILIMKDDWWSYSYTLIPLSFEAIIPSSSVSLSSYLPRDKFQSFKFWREIKWAPVKIDPYNPVLSVLSGYYFEEGQLELRFLKIPSTSIDRRCTKMFDRTSSLVCGHVVEGSERLEENVIIVNDDNYDDNYGCPYPYGFYKPYVNYYTSTDYEELGRCTLASELEDVYSITPYDRNYKFLDLYPHVSFFSQTTFPSEIPETDMREHIVALVEATTSQGTSTKIMSKANKCIMKGYLYSGEEFTYNPYDRSENCRSYLEKELAKWGNDFLNLLVPNSSEDPGCLVKGYLYGYIGNFKFFAHEAPTLDKMNQDFLTYYDSEREGKKMGWGAPKKYYYFNIETGEIDRRLYDESYIYKAPVEYLTDKNFLFFYLFPRSPFIPEPTPTVTITILPAAIMYYLRPVYLQGIELVPP